MTHGDVGDFNVDFPLSGPPTPRGVEPRSSSSLGAGNYTVLLKFNCTLTSVGGSSASESGCGTISSSGSGTISGDTYIVNLTGVCNEGYVTVTLTDVSDSCLDHSDSVSSPEMGFLIGDTNGNGLVNSTDISETQAQSGQAVTSDNFRTDVNTNGLINSTDVSIVQSKSGTGLP
jgi:hypothetical protein